MKPIIISPSNLEMYNKCRKRWHYKYVQELPESIGDDSALAIGTACHEALERAVRGAILEGRTVLDPYSFTTEELTDPYIGEILSNLGIVLPDRIVHYGVEEKIAVNQSGESVDFYDSDAMVRGILDFHAMTSERMENIYDWKSGRMIKTNIYTDRAMRIYAYMLSEKYAKEHRDGLIEEVPVYYNINNIFLRHNYIVDFQLSVEDLNTIVPYLKKTQKEMIKEAAKKTPKGSPGEPCLECPFTSICSEFTDYIKNNKSALKSPEDALHRLLEARAIVKKLTDFVKASAEQRESIEYDDMKAYIGVKKTIFYTDGLLKQAEQKGLLSSALPLLKIGSRNANEIAKELQINLDECEKIEKMSTTLKIVKNKGETYAQGEDD